MKIYNQLDFLETSPLWSLAWEKQHLQAKPASRHDEPARTQKLAPRASWHLGEAALRRPEPTRPSPPDPGSARSRRQVPGSRGELCQLLTARVAFPESLRHHQGNEPKETGRGACGSHRASHHGCGRHLAGLQEANRLPWKCMVATGMPRSRTRKG